MIVSGAIAFLALVGAAVQDRKKAELMGDAVARLAAQTAFVPFGAGWPRPAASR